MDKLIAIKIKYEDGTYSDQIPICVLATNVEWNDTYSLVDVLGSITFDTKGSVQDQLTQLFNQKVDSTDLTNYVNSTMKNEVTSWLSTYITPATGTIAYDASLSIEGAAADAKAAGQIVQISATKPTKQNNRIWVAAAENEYEVLTMDDIENLITSEYDATKTYKINDFVIHNGILYYCNTAINTAEAWTAAHWTQTSAGSQIGAIKNDLNNVQSEIYEETSEVSATESVTYINWRLNGNGYRVADNSYKIPQYRVFAGELLKIVADDKFQFQSSYVINNSGTTYRIGKTYGPGTYYLTVPTGAVYVTVSTPATDSGAHVYRAQLKVGEFIEAQEEFNAEVRSETANIYNEVRSETANIYNAYTKQVSDIEYTDSPQIISLSFDGTNMQFVAGGGKGIVLPVIGGTTVRIIKPQTSICIVCFTAEYPKAGVAITHVKDFGGFVNTNIVVESQATDKYVCVYVSTASVVASDVKGYYSQENRGTVELLPQLDSHMVNLLKYRPVGKVSKAYIALSCDDGIEPLATYTLPRIQYWSNYYSKDIPLHMALFDNSPVFANAEYTALIKDMCDNHNCSIGIHGPTPFEQYTPTYLYNFLKKQEQAIIDKTGVTPTSVIYPHSSYNDIIKTICGAWYGICGASGQIAPPYTYSDDHDLPFYVGEKSNCYEVYRLSIKDTQVGNANEAHRVIDYAIANNLIICPYFHDIDFTFYSEETNNFNKAMLDAYIQYGMEQGVEFINFGDIPYLL